ncbi:FAD/NAD(P)-binding domain-containing protein [Cadophora sp. DSE1049]|nr:FAD/NAD(P)-binding domain-containing protein [Cadophora sp. DSE1049]
MAIKPAESEFRVLIVGGGIAGLATAIALRGPNRRILILEQSSLNREIGATISLQPNASKFVEKEWNLSSALRSKGSMVDQAFRICSTDGTEHKRIDLTAKSEYGGDRMLYHRQDLHEVLKSAATSEDSEGLPVDILVKSRVVKCDCDDGSVQLEDGSVLDGFDLIVAADGIRSNIRRFVVGEEVGSLRTGQAAYRMMIAASKVEDDEDICKFLDPREAVTTMVMGHQNRLIMGPARNGEVYSIVAMVPDISDPATETSWTTEGNLDDLLEAFKEFPDWCKRLFRHAPELGLWQLRDLDPLKTWTKGKVILIGDAAHAMLPTQGQGASQAIEDAEAIGTFFKDVHGKPSELTIWSRLKLIDETRRPRATQIQLLSRESAKPATEKGDKKIKISPDQYMDYCYTYNGARAWREQQKNTDVLKKLDDLKI